MDALLNISPYFLVIFGELTMKMGKWPDMRGKRNEAMLPYPSRDHFCALLRFQNARGDHKRKEVGTYVVNITIIDAFPVETYFAKDGGNFLERDLFIFWIKTRIERLHKCGNMYSISIVES